MAVIFYIPTSNISFMSSQRITIVWYLFFGLFEFCSNSLGCEMIIHCGLHSNTYYGESIISCTYCLFGEMAIQVLFLFFLNELFSLLSSCKGSLYNLDNRSLSDKLLTIFFFFFYRLSFHFCIVSFEPQNILILMKSNLSTYFFGCLCFMCHNK